MDFQVTSHIDLVLVVLYTFWAFFAGLIYYLHRENKREGYPLLSDRSNDRLAVVGFPRPPSPKTFLLADGHSVMAPSGKVDAREVKASPVALWPGAPLEPTGNPMVDGVGPAAYAERADHPDLTFEGLVKIVPLRSDSAFYIESRDPDPRGMVVKGADGVAAGTVADVWLDRSEYIVRYYEVALEDGGRRVLLPSNFARVDGRRREIRVKAVLAHHFADVPVQKHPDQITLLEEEKICAYYGGGYLYAVPLRTESVL